jgi:hypothetical protein
MLIRTHLMFDGSAEEEMSFYVDLIPGSEILGIQRYESGDNEGKLQHGNFALAGRRPFRRVMAVQSAIVMPPIRRSRELSRSHLTSWLIINASCSFNGSIRRSEH